MELRANLWSNKLEFTSELYNSLYGNPLCYLFHGNVTSRFNEHTLSLAEDNFEVSGNPARLKRKVFYIMVECLQNITKHQDVQGFSLNEQRGLFVLQEFEDNFLVTSGNVVDNSKVEALQERLKMVNELNHQELTKLYREVLFTGELSESGGAGLGLIDMARKSNAQLGYDFKAIGAKQSFFYFQTNINLSEESTNGVAVAQEVDLKKTKELHKIISSNNVQIVYKGNFTQDSVKNLVMMTEGNIGAVEQELSKRKKVFNIMVELLQNIAKHADVGEEDLETDSAHPGIFLLGHDDGRYLLTAGNWIETSKIDPFLERLEHVNSLTREELVALYDTIIMDAKRDQKKGAGLGLIDMRLKSRNLLQFDFRGTEEKFTFFTVQVEV